MQDSGDAGGSQGKVCAHPSVDYRAQAGDFPVSGGRHLHVLHVVSAMQRSLVIFRPGLGPLDRTAQLHGAEGGDHLPGIHRGFTTEPPSYLGRNDPNFVLRNSRHHRGKEPADVGVLGIVPQRQFAHRSQPTGHSGSSLYGVGDQPRMDDGISNHDFGRGKGCVGVSSGHHPVEGLVVGSVFVDLDRPSLHRRFGVDDYRQRLVVHIDELHSIFSLIPVLRHHHGHWFARVPHNVFCHWRVINRLNV